MNQRWLLFVILFTLCPNVILPAEGVANWSVDDNGGADFMSIQSAVDTASSRDTIFVYAGRYNDFDVNKPYLNIIGEDVNLVTIDGEEIRLPDSDGDATGTILEGMDLSNVGLMLGAYKNSPDIIIKNCIINNKTTNYVNIKCTNLTFEHNIISGGSSTYGINFEKRPNKVLNNYFINNTCKGGDLSIGTSSVTECTGVVIEGNVFENFNTQHAALRLLRVSGCTISNNTFVNGTGYGIRVWKDVSVNNTIISNTFSGNSGDILFYDAGVNNKIYLNTFSDDNSINLQGTPPSITYWNSTTPIKYTYNGKSYTNYTGNYWSDYTGIDNNSDGLGDIPYELPYNLGTDYYPLMRPYKNYFGGGDNPILTSISLSSKSVYIGDSCQFMVTAYDGVGDEMSGVSYNWSSSNETVGTINKSTGLFTALAAGTATITAENGSINATTEVTVPASILSSMHLSPTGSFRVYIGETEQFSAIPFDQFGDEMPLDVEWDSSNEMVGNISSDGLFSPLTKGKTTIKAKASTDSYNATAEAEVEVVVPFFTSIAISPSSLKTYTGKAHQFSATAQDQYGKEMSGINFTWAVSNKTVGTINISTGLFTARSPGKTTVIASAEGTYTTAEINVTTSYPDLCISSVSSCYSDKNVTYTDLYGTNITATIKNDGPLDAGTFNASFMVNGNTTIFEIPELDAGNTTTIQVRDEIHRVVGEKLPIIVSVDINSSVTELNETNNEYTGNTKITVEPTSSDPYAGGRFYVGYDQVNNKVYEEGNLGVTVAVYGAYSWFNHIGTATYTADDLQIPEGAIIRSARLYQGWTWYADPTFTVEFNGHEIQDYDAKFWDYCAGQYVFNVTPYFNAGSDNTATISAVNTQNGYYGTVLVVVYEDASKPYRQIWVNEGADCLMSLPGVDEPYVGYTTFSNTETENVSSAEITTVLLSGDNNDQGTIFFNNQTVNLINRGGSDPAFFYYDVTDSLQNGTNELGVRGEVDSINNGNYFNFAVAVLEVTTETISTANFTVNTTSNYTPLCVQFTDTSTGTPTTWTWDFGDGCNSSEKNPVHTYMEPANYTVSLNISNSLGNSTITKTDYIKAGPFIEAPIAGFSGKPTNGDAPLSVEFIDESINKNSSLSPTSCSWDFGDGKNSSEQNPTHIYEAKGTYTVTLTASNYGGSNTTTKANYITVTSSQSAPIASFITDSSSGQVPFTVQFTDTSTGSISSWNWDFGDGGSSTEQSPTYTFVTAKTHTITLEATGPGGTNKTTGTITATAPLTSDSYNGGIPLTTVKTGTASGGLWFDSYQGFAASAQKTFSLPTHTKIKWARLYVDVYCGHMESNYRGSATIDIDANGDSSYELTKKEIFNTTYSFPGADGTGPVWLSDHMNRVTSDYLMWYDLTDAISGNTVNVNVESKDIDSSFDGRIKAITLVVAYDDVDSDEVYYWVNQGHDTVNPLDTTYTGSTTFDVSTLASGWDSANVSAIYYASKNGVYAFQGKTLSSGTPSGSYYGDETWDISSMLTSGENTLTYDHYNESSYFKIPLALMSVKKHAGTSPVKPTAGFIANATRGEAPLTVKFTDSSSGTPTSWVWDFDNNGTTDSTKQNPEYTYTTPGIYSVKLTVKNSAGSDDELKSDYITVLEPGSEGKPDLSISGVVNPIASTVFAREPNTIQIPVENSGFDPITNITVSLYASDISDTVPVATTNISSLEGQATTTVSLIDPAIRDLDGKTVTYTAKVDPENLIAEYNETNNNVSSSVKSVKYNGYKGKGIYWEGGSNITTKQTYDLRGSLIYSTQPESAYKSVGWKSRTETWNNSDLSIPAGTTVEKALLYISYNWDTTSGGVPDIATTFNGKTIELGTPYTDKSNFGAYADYKYGLYPAINVTDLFNRNGNNTLFMTPNSGNSNALYPSTLAVIYRDSNATRKLIFINEECDELAYSESSYGTTMEEATAYAPFTGLILDLAKVQNATLHSFAGSAGPDEGNLFFNGESLATKTWTGNLKTASAEVFNVKKFLNATDNEAAVQGTESGGMAALQQFLVVEYTETAPVADFTTDINSGDAPLTVKFTDTSTGTPVSWAWDFDNDGFTDSEEQNPKFTYETPGNYTVTLTVTNPKGTDTETKEDYITVKKPVLPIANFSADRYTGTCPLIVSFKDLSERAEGWSWDFGDGSNSTEQNPTFTYETLGNYTVKLTVSNSYGTDSYTTEIVVKEFKSEEENYNFSLKEEIESINDTTNEIVINSSNSNVAVENNTIKVSSGKLNISIHTNGITGGKGTYTNATIETESETSDLGGNLSSVNTSLNATFSENLSALLQGNASITTTVVPGAPDNETKSAFQLAGSDFAEDMEIAYSLVINKSGLDGVTIKDAYISMTVPKVYVDSHGGTEAFVVMSLHEGKVTVLESSITEGGDYYIFTAYSPDGFSVKALMSYTPKTESESSHKSGGGGGSSEKLKIIPAETQVSSITESGEASTEEQESETEKMEITPVHEDKEDNKPASDVGNKNETESEGKIPGFEVPLVVFGGVLVFGMKRRRGEKRE